MITSKGNFQICNLSRYDSMFLHEAKSTLLDLLTAKDRFAAVITGFSFYFDIFFLKYKGII